MRLAVAIGIVLLVPSGAQDPEYRYERGGVVLDILGDDLQAEFGWSLSDCSIVTEGDTLILRTKSPLTEEQKKKLDQIIARQPDYRKNPELLKGDAIHKRAKDRQLGPWRKKYADCKTDGERISVLAEFLELTEKK